MALREMLALLRPRPGLYFGEHSLVRFEAYLNGYRGALDDVKALTEDDEYIWTLIMNFHTFVAERYRTAPSRGWAYIIAEQVNGDDKAAVDLFWVEWDRFLEVQQKALGAHLKNSTPRKRHAQRIRKGR